MNYGGIAREEGDPMYLRGLNDLRSSADIRTVLSINAGSLPGSGQRISKIQLQLKDLKRLIHREELLNRRQRIFMTQLEWMRQQELDLGRSRKQFRFMVASIERDKLALYREIKKIGGKLACN